MPLRFNPPVKATTFQRDAGESTDEDEEFTERGPILGSDIEIDEELTIPPDTVFPQSVASGDPTSEGAVLWTRIAHDIYESSHPLIVDVANDESFDDPQRVLVQAEEISPEHDYTVKVDLDVSDVELDANTRYHYRFVYNGTRSQTGSFQTLPEQDSQPERIRFAVVTCQDYMNGNFGAYHHIAESDLDFILDLGDFIYEYGKQVPGRRAYPERQINLPSRNWKASTLDDYRYLYKRYHSDSSLQRALEEHARIFTWDDHEFANDLYWDDQGVPRAPDHPADEGSDGISHVVEAALKAWWEYTPTRAEYDPDAKRLNERLKIYRSFQFGDLLTLVVTDERLFKTEPGANCAEARLPDWIGNRLPEWLPFCYVNKNPAETMLGKEQREWFIDQIVEAPGLWTAWANEVLTLPARVGIGPFGVDPSDQAWDGYESEREKLMYRIKYGEVENFLTLTGDMHSYLVGYQRLDYPSPVQELLTNQDPATEQSRRVGVELMTPAMTSVNIAEKFSEGFVNCLPKSTQKSFPGMVERSRRLVGNGLEGLFRAATLRLMPHIEAFDSHQWGYSEVELTRTHCTHRAYSVDKTAEPAESERKVINAVRIPEGKIEIETLHEVSSSIRT